MGNPLTYFNGTRWNLTWQYGRALASATGNGTAVTYSYDMDGIRSSKTVDGVEHAYINLDGKVIRETYGNVQADYLYDAQGRPYRIDVIKNGTTYTGYFVLNQQGDVIAILDEDGNLAVTYTYDAWGRILKETAMDFTDGSVFADVNALKYRGYYHDKETGFYYLNTRYYDPETGRFINADTTDVLNASGDLYDKNLYAYCDNNPVMRMDSNGEFWNIAAGAVIGASISVVSQVVGNALSGDDLGKGVILAAISGAASGALSASALNRTMQTVCNAGIGFISEAINQHKQGTLYSTAGFAAVAKATVAGGISGYIGGDGMRNRNSQYYKTAQSAKTKVQTVLSKKYSNPTTPTKIINRAAKTVRTVGYKESRSTGIKFGIGSMLSQLITRFRWKK